MKLVLKNNKVVATHTDDQNITLNMYPFADEIKIVPDDTKVYMDSGGSIFDDVSGTSLTGQIIDSSLIGTYELSDDQVELMSAIRKQINEKTEELINNGFTFKLSSDPQENEYTVAMTRSLQENNMNIGIMLDNDILEYPQKIKISSGNNYLVVSDKDDKDELMTAVVNFIAEKINDGRALKDGGTVDGVSYSSLADYTLDQLKNFEDPR